jgi:hypothetical protein
MDDAQTQILGPDPPPKKLCMGSIKIFWSSPDTSCSRNWGSLGKKMQTLPFFVPSPIKVFFFFFLGEILPKSDPKKNGSNLPKGKEVKNVTSPKGDESEGYVLNAQRQWSFCHSILEQSQPSDSPKVFHPKVGGCQGYNLMGKMYNYMVPKPSR